MKRMLGTTLGIVALLTMTIPAQAGECKGCAKIQAGHDGFCCGHGRAFGLELSSKKLYDILKGHEVSAKKVAGFPCPGCKKAVATHGSCDHCKYVDGKIYESPIGYALAKGTPVSDEQMQSGSHHCPKCMEAMKTNGRCSECGVGFVAGRMFKSTESYEAALASYKVLQRAVKASGSCESCALAMLTNGTCDKCKVSFKDGKMVDNG